VPEYFSSIRREKDISATGPVVHHDPLCLSEPDEVDPNSDDGVHAADRSGVVLDEAVVADGPSEVELLVLVHLASGDHDRANVPRAMRGAIHCRSFQGDVFGEVVQPHRVVRLAHTRHATLPLNQAI